MTEYAKVKSHVTHRTLGCGSRYFRMFIRDKLLRMRTWKFGQPMKVYDENHKEWILPLNDIEIIKQ